MFYNNAIHKMEEGLEAVQACVKACLHGQILNTEALTRIEEKVDTIMADRGALDAAITTLNTEVTNLVALCNQLIAKGQATAAESVDFGAEIEQLNTIGSNATSALSSATTAAQSANVPQPGEASASSTPTATTSASGTSTAAGDTSTATGTSASTDTATSTSDPSTSTSATASEETPSTSETHEATEANTAPESHS